MPEDISYMMQRRMILLVKSIFLYCLTQVIFILYELLPESSIKLSRTSKNCSVDLKEAIKFNLEYVLLPRRYFCIKDHFYCQCRLALKT